MRNLALRIAGSIGQCWSPSKRVVVFVDGDSVSAHHVEIVLNHLRDRSVVSQVRVFGNINNSNVKSWSSLTKSRGLIVRHMAQLADGKNGADIALATDAVELHLTRPAPIYALIASDADFTPLVVRLKQDGAKVLGFGHRSAPVTLRSVCTSFNQISDLEKGNAKGVDSRTG
ncbi:NYN domain-containing protein [Devosia sp. FKR38]|uniref:NYN domain-containing protein n=1 Tax=Devosia sp. FKR38 TaxID=2562312 RepID=UPI0014854702|nr:NYN domain-containing protein [Devosia sp. FKR38]